jgi:hypothetical protein
VTDINGSEPPPQQVLTLFLIVVDMDGSSRAVLNTDERFMAQRIAGPKDVLPACANVVADFQGLKTAEAIMSFQAQLARQMVPQETTQPPTAS